MSNVDLEINVEPGQLDFCVERYVVDKLSSASVEVFERTLKINGDHSAALYDAIVNEYLIEIIETSITELNDEQD